MGGGGGETPPHLFYGYIMEIIFYSLTDDRRKLNKTLLNGVSVQNVTLKNNDNKLSKLSIVLNTDITGKNYCYISELQKYYFIDNVSIISNTLKRYDLNIDVLMSYKSAILNAELNIIQCDSNYINEDKADIEKSDYFNFRKINIENDFFNQSTNILVVKK